MPKRSSPPRRLPASGPKTAHQRELNTKRRGELSELAFAHKAASEGFGVAKPYGDSERFDFILISRNWPEGDKLWRVQVKSTATLNEGFYHVNAHRRTTGRVTAYKPTEVDFLVAHIIPDDSWFIFPIQVLATCTSPSFRPKRSRRKGIYEPYREAWHLLRPPK
jgi:PD-(D/E)XK endonuclease